MQTARLTERHLGSGVRPGFELHAVAYYMDNKLPPYGSVYFSVKGNIKPFNIALNALLRLCWSKGWRQKMDDEGAAMPTLHPWSIFNKNLNPDGPLHAAILK